MSCNRRAGSRSTDPDVCVGPCERRLGEGFRKPARRMTGGADAEPTFETFHYCDSSQRSTNARAAARAIPSQAEKYLATHDCYSAKTLRH